MMNKRVKEERLLLQNGDDHIHDFSLPRLGKQSRRSKSGDETLFASKKKILEHSLQIRYQFCQTPLLAPTGALNRWPLAIVQYPLDNIQQNLKNIARGTTDPEIDSVTRISCKFDHQMAPLASVVKLATRWRHLY